MVYNLFFHYALTTAPSLSSLFLLHYCWGVNWSGILYSNLKYTHFSRMTEWLGGVCSEELSSIPCLWIYCGLVKLFRRRQWHPTLVLLPGKSHRRKSRVGCSPWGRKESDRNERLDFHFSLSCIGEGNGNPLQCSCLENLRDGGAWWAAIYGVTQSRTRLKRLSSSSSSSQAVHRKKYMGR